MITINQVEALLREATMEYQKTGANYEEVAYYAVMLREMSKKEKN